ncbi:MAG: preprotein translocase subunit SecF [Actinomycetota bacterium]|nr:preprotein translocase subunit SecF [Actinomycetota bacterium]
MSRVGNFTGKLYRGEVSYDIVGRKKLWYTISALILLLAIGGILFRGLNLGIEFRGGAEFVVPKSSCSVTQVREVAGSTGATSVVVQELGESRIRLQTEALSPAQSAQMIEGLAAECKVPANEIKIQLVGPSWGGEITKKALLGLLVFMIAVVIFLSIYFEWRMAMAALVALVHDVVITVGIYALVGFEVTPATVIGILTILGFSLYDTVVVFDKVKENTRGILGQSRMTYSEAANLALNQTLIRSINTSIVALLPVAAILFVGVGLLGAGTLKDLALALFVGLLAGTYSSLFVATPFLCQLKEAQPQMKSLAQRVLARRAGASANRKGADGAGEVTAGTGGSGGGTDGEGAEAAAVTAAAAVPERKERPHRQAGPRNQPKNTPRSKR